jgi:hypothetical protein
MKSDEEYLPWHGRLMEMTEHGISLEVACSLLCSIYAVSSAYLFCGVAGLTRTVFFTIYNHYKSD